MQKRWIAATAVGFVLATLPLAAQPRQRGCPIKATYDPAVELTVQGTVESVNERESAMGWNGVHLALRSAETSYEVHLGPAVFIHDSGIKFALGDLVQLTGVPSDSTDGTTVLVARQIVQDGVTRDLRDEKGLPLWNRRGRRFGLRR